jgi:ATP-dependent Zn protease
MGRRHRNKAPVPKTTWAISLEVDDMVSKTKGRHNTIDDFIKKVFEQWLEWKDTIPFMEEAYEKQSKINVHHVKEIESLKQLLQQYEQKEGEQQSQIINKSIL